MKKTAVIGLVLSATMLIGCGSKDEAKTPQEATQVSMAAKTPQEAVQGFMDAAMANKVDDAMAYVKAEGDEKPVREMVAGLCALSEFSTAVEETYGEGSMKKLGMTLPTGKLSAEEHFDFKIDGDTASAMAKDGSGRPMELVKADGVWRVKMVSTDAATAAGMMEMILGPIKTMRPKVDKEKYPFEKFKAELDAEGQKAARSMMGL